MKLKALHGFCVGGGVDVAPDQEFDAPDNLAAQWITSGAAILAERGDPVPVPVVMDAADDASGEGSAAPEAPVPQVEGSPPPDAPATVVTTSAPKGQKGK